MLKPVAAGERQEMTAGRHKPPRQLLSAFVHMSINRLIHSDGKDLLEWFESYTKPPLRLWRAG